MMKKIHPVLTAAMCLFLLTGEAHASEALIPVGQVVGLELRNNSVSIAAFDDALGAAARQAGLQIGDEILDIDGKKVDQAADVRQALTHSDGRVRMTVLRKEKEHQLSLTPQVTPAGPRLGVYLRQGVTGIGTVTWYDPETGRFGTLGHGVNDANGKPVELTEGTAYEANVLSVKRGKCGEPGQLRGGVNTGHVLGTVEKNTPQGVFGTIQAGWTGDTFETASRAQVKTGPAIIRSTVNGKAPREYSVEIQKIYPGNRPEGRNMLIKVTDPDLLNATGGIVQGMSGSPIIQDGKLVGAVTHVLVNDPTMGYGIFIENMLDAAS